LRIRIEKLEVTKKKGETSLKFLLPLKILAIQDSFLASSKSL
jgi:hypothetical protein